MRIIGIDPGKNGAAACITDGMLEWIYPFRGEIERCRKVYEMKCCLFVLERVSSSPQQGVVSAFTFGRYSEAVESAAILSGIPLIVVRPQKWQEALGCLSGGDKKVTYHKAQRLFPGKAFKRDEADAVLLAYYGHKYLEYN